MTVNGNSFKNDLPAIESLICFLDFETTGSVSGYPNEPWQIGLVSVEQGRIDTDSLIESYIRVDATRPFNPHAPGRHAVLRNEIAHAPAREEVWSSLRTRLSGTALGAHNTATEKKMLRFMAPMEPWGPWIDTLKLARKAWPSLASYKLEDLIESFELGPRIIELCPGRDAHDALYDAVASAVLFLHLLEQPGWASVRLSDLASD